MLLEPSSSPSMQPPPDCKELLGDPSHEDKHRSWVLLSGLWELCGGWQRGGDSSLGERKPFFPFIPREEAWPSSTFGVESPWLEQAWGKLGWEPTGFSIVG